MENYKNVVDYGSVDLPSQSWSPTSDSDGPTTITLANPEEDGTRVSSEKKPQADSESRIKVSKVEEKSTSKDLEREARRRQPLSRPAGLSEDEWKYLVGSRPTHVSQEGWEVWLRDMCYFYEHEPRWTRMGYRNQWIAVHKERIVARALDEDSLLELVDGMPNAGRAPVYMDQVGPEERVLPPYAGPATWL